MQREQLAELSLQLQQGSVDVLTVQQLLQQQQQLLQELYCRIRSEEDIDAMARTLDSLMVAVFSYLKSNLPPMRNKPAAAAEVAAAAATAAAATERETAAAGDYSPCVNDSPLLSPACDAALAAAASGATTAAASAAGTSSHDPPVAAGAATGAAAAAGGGGGGGFVSEADVLVAELLDAFIRVVLPSHSCRFTQFILFFVASLDGRWAQLLLQQLFHLLVNRQRHSRLVRANP